MFLQASGTNEERGFEEQNVTQNHLGTVERKTNSFASEPSQSFEVIMFHFVNLFLISHIHMGLK